MRFSTNRKLLGATRLPPKSSSFRHFFWVAFSTTPPYTLKTFDGKRYLERFEDRVVIIGANVIRQRYRTMTLVDEIIDGRFHRAFLILAEAAREAVSCFCFAS